MMRIRLMGNSVNQMIKGEVSLGFGCGVEVFDEDGFVADFVVDEFVDGALGEEKAVAAGAHAFLLALGDVSGGIILGVREGSVADGFLTESGAGVADAKDHGARGADGGDF